jgi:hypothetical protein
MLGGCTRPGAARSEFPQSGRRGPASVRGCAGAMPPVAGRSGALGDPRLSAGGSTRSRPSPRSRATIRLESCLRTDTSAVPVPGSGSFRTIVGASGRGAISAISSSTSRRACSTQRTADPFQGLNGECAALDAQPRSTRPFLKRSASSDHSAPKSCQAAKCEPGQENEEIRPPARATAVSCCTSARGSDGRSTPATSTSSRPKATTRG